MLILHIVDASPLSSFKQSSPPKPPPQAVLERLMWHLSSASSPTDAQLFAPAHLAAVLLAEVPPSREAAAEKGGWRCYCPLLQLLLCSGGFTVAL